MAKVKKIKLPNETNPRDIVDSGAVRYDEATSLTDAQKTQARTNIGAVDTTYVASQISDLGKALKFIGRATSNISDGSTASAASLGIDGYSTRRKGDVILNYNDGREFVWDGSAWEELGKEGSWALSDHNHSGVYAPVSHTHAQSDITGLSTALSGKVDTVEGKGLSTNDYTTTEKTKLSGIAENANNYSHPTSAGNKHIPSGGSSGQILKWSSSGTAVWGDESVGATYSRGTVSVSSATNSINIPITITDTSSLSVYQNGLLLTPTTHYTATTSAITLTYNAKVGDIFTFVGSTESGVALNASADEVLFTDTNSNFPNCTTVNDALDYIGSELGDSSNYVTDDDSRLTDSRTPTSHASSTSTFGAGNGSNYGHVKLSDSTSTTSGVSGGVAATPTAVKSAYDLATTAKNTADAAMPISGGTFTGATVAQNNTNYTTKQIRNVILSTSSPTSSDGANGDIWIKYKA